MILVGENGNSLASIQKIFVTLIVVTIIFLVLWFIWYKKEKVVRGKLKERYQLELLDNSKKDIYLFKTRSADHFISYQFSYVDKDGKKVTVDRPDVKVKEMENLGKKAYVEFYTNKYVPNGFLDYLFYNEKNKDDTICILYMKKDMIKFKRV